MTAKLTTYTVLPHADGVSACANCGAKLRAGEQAVSVYDPDGLSYHEHLPRCQRNTDDGASVASRLMNDIRAGKPPANPDPAHARRKVQGS